MTLNHDSLTSKSSLFHDSISLSTDPSRGAAACRTLKFGGEDALSDGRQTHENEYSAVTAARFQRPPQIHDYLQTEPISAEWHRQEIPSDWTRPIATEFQRLPISADWQRQSLSYDCHSRQYSAIVERPLEYSPPSKHLTFSSPYTSASLGEVRKALHQNSNLLVDKALLHDLIQSIDAKLVQQFNPSSTLDADTRFVGTVGRDGATYNRQSVYRDGYPHADEVYTRNDTLATNCKPNNSYAVVEILPKDEHDEIIEGSKIVEMQNSNLYTSGQYIVEEDFHTPSKVLNKVCSYLTPPKKRLSSTPKAIAAIVDLSQKKNSGDLDVSLSISEILSVNDTGPLNKLMSIDNGVKANEYIPLSDIVATTTKTENVKLNNYFNEPEQTLVPVSAETISDVALAESTPIKHVTFKSTPEIPSEDVSVMGEIENDDEDSKATMMSGPSLESEMVSRRIDYEMEQVSDKRYRIFDVASGDPLTRECGALSNEGRTFDRATDIYRLGVNEQMPNEPKFEVNGTKNVDENRRTAKVSNNLLTIDPITVSEKEELSRVNLNKSVKFPIERFARHIETSINSSSIDYCPSSCDRSTAHSQNTDSFDNAGHESPPSGCLPLPKPSIVADLDPPCAAGSIPGDASAPSAGGGPTAAPTVVLELKEKCDELANQLAMETNMKKSVEANLSVSQHRTATLSSELQQAEDLLERERRGRQEEVIQLQQACQQLAFRLFCREEEDKHLGRSSTATTSTTTQTTSATPGSYCTGCLKSSDLKSALDRERSRVQVLLEMLVTQEEQLSVFNDKSSAPLPVTTSIYTHEQVSSNQTNALQSSSAAVAIELQQQSEPTPTRVNQSETIATWEPQSEIRSGNHHQSASSIARSIPLHGHRSEVPRLPICAVSSQEGSSSSSGSDGDDFSNNDGNLTVRGKYEMLRQSNDLSAADPFSKSVNNETNYDAFERITCTKRSNEYLKNETNRYDDDIRLNGLQSLPNFNLTATTGIRQSADRVLEMMEAIRPFKSLPDYSSKQDCLINSPATARNVLCNSNNNPEMNISHRHSIQTNGSSTGWINKVPSTDQPLDQQVETRTLLSELNQLKFIEERMQNKKKTGTKKRLRRDENAAPPDHSFRLLQHSPVDQITQLQLPAQGNKQQQTQLQQTQLQQPQLQLEQQQPQLLQHPRLQQQPKLKEQHRPHLQQHPPQYQPQCSHPTSLSSYSFCSDIPTRDTSLQHHAL